ncbi:uncharacterized protein LOC106180851 [Lingula anatina]|uniref:Uncharacterized protein LOC106180851 n=1 Tax=Lingula anatina TaxID=7574 RepID=A0A1S3KD93_LINAN|nr:uncharacterized protein LOC106180851 [Lingula anatina]|eukprot:XP_013420467.1 uncharacterized protein LOC106180851 [Lingula anatina]
MGDSHVTHVPTRYQTMAAAQICPFEIPRNEKENYFRMHLLLEQATDVLRDVLRTQLQAAYPGLFDPSKTDKLFDVLDNQQVKHSVRLLKKRNVMNSSQMKLLYPSGTPSTTVTTQDLDITLVVVLLRNITNLNPQAKWENPTASDTSIEANIGRVKTYRNQLSHGHHLGITDTAFQTEFDALKQVLLSLSPIYTSDDYDKLLLVPLDAKVAPCQLLSVQLPGKLADLKGREDLVQQIQQHIAGETRLVLLTGMGGIGKTSVAIEVGHREQNVLYFDMRQVTNLESVKLSLVQHYHPTRSLKDLYGDYQNILIQTLSSLTSDTVIIFDNNDEIIKSNLQDFHSLFQNFLNSSKHITLLCTSREAFSVMSHNMAVLDVPPLENAPSIDILLEGKPTSPNYSESLMLGEIAEKCGRNPLALKLLAVQLKKKTAQRVLDRMKNKNVIASLKVANLPASQEMMACLDMSYEALNSEEQKLFRALHIFPVSFLVGEVSEMFSEILEIDEDECESILDSLCNKSLLSADHSVYDLHPLLKAYAAFQSRKDQNEISCIQDAYRKHYMKQVPHLIFKSKYFPSKELHKKAQNALPHFKVIADLLLHQLRTNKQDKEMQFLYTNLISIARVFQLFFLYPEALTILKTLEMVKENMFRFAQIGTFFYVIVGDVLYGMGKYKEALTYYKKSLEIQRENFGEKHPDTSWTYHKIGIALCDMGKYVEALSYYENSLEIKKEIFGEKHPDTATTYHGIGSALCEMGKYVEALKYYEKSFEIQKEILGEKHIHTVLTRRDIGNLLGCMGKYAESLNYYETSLEIQKEILGEKHPRTAGTYHNIGTALCDMGKYTEALTYYDKYLEFQKETLGEQHPDTGTAYFSVGNALSQMGKYAAALTYYEKSLEIQKETLGEKHPDTAGTYHNIGNALNGMCKSMEALTYYEKSLAIQKEIFGEKHPDTGRTYHSIGRALYDMRKYAEALTYFEKSLEIRKLIYGEQHPSTATTYNSIGIAFLGLGKYAEAFAYYEKSLEINEEIPGEKYTDYSMVYRNIDNALCCMGKYKEALKYYEKSLEKQKDALGGKHPDTAWTYQNIGNALCDMGKYAEGLTYYEESLKITKELLGEIHPDTGLTYQSIGSALYQMDKYAEALSYYEKSREVFVEHFGIMDSKTRSLDSLVRDVKIHILKKVIMNIIKYIATELIVKGKYGQAGRFLSFIGWDFNLYYKF